MTDRTDAPTAATTAAPATDNGGIKDTIESILIAFILAFIFRAFVVEAFVIPTGSMAPTLLGAHMRYACEDCGYEFTVNFSTNTRGDDIVIPHNAGPFVTQDRNGNRTLQNRTYNLNCPNCGYRLRPNDTTNPPVHYGDRILVLKYLYLLQDPHRWDVVVFKNPEDDTKQYAQNYIKRLVGRPGESVLILDGDVYVAPVGSSSIRDFKVQPKPRYVQEALWRVVYDNDFHPRKLDRVGRKWRQPWTPVGAGTGWDLGNSPTNGRTFRFDNMSDASAIYFDASANPDTLPLTDWLAYDQVEYRDMPSGAFGTPVSDVKLSFFYTRQEGDGPLRLSLSKQDTVFTAELTPTGVRLLKRVGDNGAETEVGAVNTPLPAGRAVHVEFANVDYRVSLRVDDKDLIVTAPSDYAPDPARVLADSERNQAYPRPTVRIEAGRQKASFAHVGLFRDVYYINKRPDLRWGVPRDFPENVIHLSNAKGKEEFFVLGDNSVVSGDSRFWMRDVNLPAENLVSQSGRVPGRFMLGKAFFVYWPAGYRPQPSMPGLVPNFGQMRFIH